MSVWVAFLRGVNLGRRRMKMAELGACCEGIGLTEVKTILAGGNVRFRADGSGAEIKGRLEEALQSRFGYPVGVVLRSIDEIESMLERAPFGRVDPAADVALHVLLADVPIEPEPDLSLLAANIEVAGIDARNIYFVAHRLPSGRYTEGLGALDRLLPRHLVFTMRNWNTILKVRD